MNALRSSLASVAAAIVLLAGFSAPARAEFNIAQYPLFIQQPIKPAFIMAVDNSGSMTAETNLPGREGWPAIRSFSQSTLHCTAFNTSGQCTTWATTNIQRVDFFNDTGQLQDGETSATGGTGGTVQTAPHLFLYPGKFTGWGGALGLAPIDAYGFSRSHEFNPLYFNPNRTYEPWLNYDGITRRANASITAARIHPDQTANAFNLTTAREVTSEDTIRYRVFRGTRLQAGTRYRGTCTRLRDTGTSWLTLQNDAIVDQNCDLYFSYFPATFYLGLTSPVPPGFNPLNRVLALDACGIGCNMFRYEIRSSNYASAAAYNAAIQNFANWFQYHRNRALAMSYAMSESFKNVDFMRIGYFRINDGTPTLTMRDMETTVGKQALYTDFHALNTTGSTPNLRAVNHIGNQFKRTDSGAPVRLACQINAGMLFTDGYANQAVSGIGNQDGGMGAPFADTHSNTMADVATQFYLDPLRTGPAFPAGIVPVPAACNAANPDPRLDCQNFPHMNFHAITFGARGRIFNPSNPVDPFVTAVAWPPYEAGDRSTIDDIWHATVNTRGRMIQANQPEEIASALTEIIQDVLDRSRRAGGVAGSSSRIDAGFLAYIPEYSGDDWTGDMKAYSLQSNGQLAATPVWSAAAKLASVPAGSRNIFAVRESAGSFNMVPFSVSGLGGATAAQAALGITPTDFAEMGNATIDQIVAYLRGDRSREVVNGGPLRTRSAAIGDILNSQPALNNAVNFGYAMLATSEGGGASGAGSYGAYVADKRSRSPLVFVGSNDGMLHAVSSGPGGGDVRFSVVPNSALGYMKELPKQGYQHLYYVDGSPTQHDVRIGSAWRTMLLSYNGAGGKSIMALDVTNAAASFGPGNFMWEFRHNNLGHVINPPTAGLLEGGDWVVFTGNGLNSSDHRARLMVLNASNGSLRDSVVVGSGSITDPNGLTSAVPMDTDFNGKVDAIYGGDMHGNVWKFNVSSTGSIGPGSLLFTATDSGGTRQPITGTIDSAPHHIEGQMVVFGTGKYVEVGDNLPTAQATTQTQTLYGIWDKNDGSPVGGRANLQPQQITGVSTSNGRESRQLSSNTVNWDNQRGWYLDLSVGSAEGERSVGRPRIFLGSAAFTTLEPQGDECSPGALNRLYLVGLLTGAPALNLNNGSSDTGSVVISQGAPVFDPPIGIISPPSSGPRQDDPRDPDGNLIEPLDGGNCTSRLAAIVGTEGVVDIGLLNCGRQSWRQLQ
jgi:type IV pilus assembly protein PilY1